MSEGEQANHVKVEKMRAVADLIEITYPKTGLEIGECS